MLFNHTAVQIDLDHIDDAGHAIEQAVEIVGNAQVPDDRFEAAAKASAATGAPITTHTDNGTVGDVQQRLLTDEGVSAHRIVIGHSCGTSDHDYHMKIYDFIHSRWPNVCIANHREAREGFVRQEVGWREFMYWQYWRLMPELSDSNYWEATRSLPNFFWDGETRLNCLSHVITRALQTGYTHHIERLMILSNFCQLVGIKPDEVNKWFLTVYIDAYEWVMLPNVYGMGLYADGGRIGTKPYISSANYINKMSDYCQSCSFNKKLRTGDEACPYNYLYWNFMLEHEERLRSNPRMGRSLLGLRHIDQKEGQQIQAQANEFLDQLA